MGVSISGSNAISGLGGQDTDFDKVLSQLKEIEKTQLNRLEAWKSDWNLRYEAFTQIIEQIQAASNLLSTLSDKNNFVTKLVQSSNDNVITAVANASAQDVQHNINVSQVASNAIWANTGHVFETKNDIINTTGTDQYFSYTYAGQRHDFKVPANTTLDSFVSMINNSSDNPGIKVSLIQTGNGYVFQVAGKDTGAANDLIIHDSKLVGMNSAGSTSTWVTNTTLDISDQLTNPNSYIFDVVLEGGVKKSITVKGNATAEEFKAALESSFGSNAITVDIDADGTVTLGGIQSITRRLASADAYKPASTKLELSGAYKDDDGNYLKLNATGALADGMGDEDLIKFTLTLDDGTTREIEIKAGATNRDLFVALNQAAQGGSGIDASYANNKLTMTLSGVSGITYEAADPANNDKIHTDRLTGTTTAATGTKNTLGGSLSSASTTLTFDTDKLGDKISDGDVETLRFTIVGKDGTTRYFDIDSDQTWQDLLDRVQAECGANATLSTDADGKTVLTLDNVKGFELTSGTVKSLAYTTDLKTTTTIPASATYDPENSLFYTDDNGELLLEKAPDLVYTIQTNDGKTGTLTLASGSTMADVYAAMKNTGSSAWEWTELDENGDPVATTPPGLSFRLKDADGNEVALADVDGPVYFEIDNIVSSSGPGMVGQISASSNWNIQRAANAFYQVDNWPIVMESATNSISDVIEGVVFTIQDEGQARITISTDITSVEQSIQNFLDAVNSVLLTVNELMKYDENKTVTSNDPNDIGNDNYSASGLTSQKGSLLTGNYGVQLFKSRFSSLLGANPPGFRSQQTANDILSGDVLASLANLGIKTDTDATSDTYGLLVLAPSSSIAAIQSMDKENYTNMITNNLEAVVDFFCTSGTGSSTSTDFRYGSHVDGITKAGTYEVTYHVDENGNISNVMVGGVPATRDLSQPGNYFSVASGDARGLSILIDDLTVGDHPPAGEEPMYVRIKQGLVQTTNNFLKAELVFNDVSISANATPDQIADAIALKSQNGALMSLRANYLSVMESIDTKIEREQRRIETWESRQKAIFANLETLLKQFEQQQSQLEAQLAQLSGNS